MSSMQIREDNLETAEVIALVQDHVQRMTLHSPPCSIHALAVESLRAYNVTFWTAWEGAELLGCGALKQLSLEHGEIKSMRTADAHLRKGIGARMLEHIMNEARRRSYRRLSLETGSAEAFSPARLMYTRYGFTECEPFGDYVLDPYSVFMTRQLD